MMAEQLVSQEQFNTELRELGETMAADGKVVIKTLLTEAEVNNRANCRFENWPDHLKADAYRKLGLEPVQMYRRVSADPIGDALRALPIIGVLNVDNPRDPRHKEWKL